MDLSAAALTVFLVVFAALAIGSHFVTAQEVVWHIQPPDQILFWPDVPWISALMTLAALLIMMLAYKGLRMAARFHLHHILCVLWVAAAIFWVWGSQLEPHADFEMLVESAKAFARDDFSIFFNHHYFHDYTYQLGFCLVMEGLLRAFPFIDLSLTMQIINAGLVMLTAVVLGKYAKEMLGERCASVASAALYLLFLPAIFFCSYVYGTVPMMLMIACSFLCFTRYTRERRLLWGILCAVCIGTAVVFKPNAMVALIALCIAIVLHAMAKRDVKSLAYAALAAALALLLPKLVEWFYAWRSGVEFSDDISMLARLAMGFQDARSGPGWYNNYTSFYSTTVISHEEAHQMHVDNLAGRMQEFAQNPAMFVQFMRDKCCSMWLEPTYSTLWNGSLSVKNGPYNGMAIQLCREGMPMRAILEKYMDAFQQAMYVLACIGACRAFKKRSDPVQSLLPVLILGGFLYHMLFEAKSQYIFVYAFFLMPLAAQGLCALEKKLRVLRRKRSDACN